MSVCIYRGGYETAPKSGGGTAPGHQTAALQRGGVPPGGAPPPPPRARARSRKHLTPGATASSDRR